MKERDSAGLSHRVSEPEPRGRSEIAELNQMSSASKGNTSRSASADLMLMLKAHNSGVR